MASAAGEPMPVERPRARPNVLAYPSPTTSRFIVFLAALLTAGAFVGGWVHNQVLGHTWVRTVIHCQQQGALVQTSAGGLSGEIRRNAVEERCRASVERRRAAFSFGGALTAGGAGLLVLFLVPVGLERRRSLRLLPPALAGATGRASELALSLRLRRTPMLMLGPSTMRDAFSYGTPGHYRIALPPAVAVRWHDRTLFDPLIDHELAHIEHRDVALAWLARSVWYALAPLLVLPIVVSVFSGDLSLMPDYVWRAALLAITVQLTSSALLRSREHDADLRAAQATGGPERVAALVARTRDAGARAWWRRALAKHPSTAERLAVLEQPPLAARLTFIDGLTSGFLAGLSIPVIVSVLTTVLIGSGHTDDAMLLASCLAGPLLAGSIGLGLCRAALVNRVDGRSASPARPAFGVAAGLALGEAASLAQTGAGAGSLHPLAWLPLLALLGGSATVLAASVAELLADAAPAARRAWTSWLLALLVMAPLFSAALWIGTVLETPLTLGWRGAEAWLVTSLESWLVLSALAAVGIAVLWRAWAARSDHSAPAWILESGAMARWPAPNQRDLVRALVAGLLAGAVAAAALAVYRVAAGPAATEIVKEQRYYLFVWMGAAAALAAALSVALSRAPRGAALAALAGTVACLVTVAGWLALNTALGGSLYWSFVSAVARQPLALSFPLVVMAAPAMLVRLRWAIAAPVAWGTTAMLVLAATGVLIGERASLPPLSAAAAAATIAPAAPPASRAAELYVTRFAPEVFARYLRVEHAVAAIDADTTADGPTRALLISRHVLPPLRALLSDAGAYRTTSADVEATNATCVAALRSSVRAFQTFALAFASNDVAALASARAAGVQAQSYWSSWQRQVLALAR